MRVLPHYLKEKPVNALNSRMYAEDRSSSLAVSVPLLLYFIIVMHYCDLIWNIIAILFEIH